MDNNDTTKEIVAEVTKEIAKDVYDDAIHPSAKNVGGVLGTFTGFFNQVVMYPLKKLNIVYEQKAIAFEKQIQQKYNLIPENNRIDPQLHIVGPTMESLKYNIMDDDLAEMFSNLLVSNMDNRTQNLCTPSFVKVIEQLSPNDAKTFVLIYNNYRTTGTGPICQLNFIQSENPEKRLIQRYYPRYFLEILPDSLDMNQTSKSLQSLERLGLLNINFLKWFNDEARYTDIANSESAKRVVEFARITTGKAYEAKVDSKGIVELNEYSLDFAKVCLR